MAVHYSLGAINSYPDFENHPGVRVAARPLRSFFAPAQQGLRDSSLPLLTFRSELAASDLSSNVMEPCASKLLPT